MSAVLGELVGTMILIIFGAGVVAGVVLKGTKSEASGWIVITLAWGLGVAMGVYAVGEISGAHLNPAVTVGMALVGEFAWSQVPAYIGAQLAGAFIGATLVWLHYYPHWKNTQDTGAKLAVFATDPAIKHTPGNYFSEVLGTFVLVLGILAIGANEFTQGLNPLIVGLLIVVIGLSLGGTTGYAINPARDLGPRIAHAVLPIFGKGESNWQYAWIPVAGPIIGGGLGALFYAAVFEGIVYTALYVFIALFFAVLFIALQIHKREIQHLPNEDVIHNPKEQQA
jgi:glycerol uptake facilitator protein